MPINEYQYRLICIDFHWLTLIFIDRHWCQCHKFDLALIGIDQHWSLIQHVLLDAVIHYTAVSIYQSMNNKVANAMGPADSWIHFTQRQILRWASSMPHMWASSHNAKHFSLESDIHILIKWNRMRNRWHLWRKI